MTPEEAVKAFEAEGWFASAETLPTQRLYILGGRKRVERKGRVVGYQDSFAIMEESDGMFQGTVPIVPHDGQMFVRESFPTLAGAVDWTLRTKRVQILPVGMI